MFDKPVPVQTVPLYWVPLMMAVLGLVGVHLSYGIAVAMDHIVLCNPYWDSCTSISRTGRKPPEKLVFKGFIMPVMMLGLLFWVVLGSWLRRRVGVGRSLQVLGVIANTFVILYIVALGEGSDYNLLRRTGVILFFGLTLFAQLLFVYYCQRYLLPVSRNPPAIRCYRVMHALAIVTFIVCILSVLLSAFYSGYHRIDDAFEWNIALLMNAHFFVHVFLWRALDIKVVLA